MIDQQELEQQIHRVCADLLDECDQLKHLAQNYAESENKYRMAKAQAYIKAEGKTVDAKKAEVDIICERERLAATSQRDYWMPLKRE